MASRVITNFRTAPARTLKLSSAGTARWIFCAILLLAVLTGAHAIGAPASFEHRRGLLAIVAGVFVAGVLLRRLRLDAAADAFQTIAQLASLTIMLNALSCLFIALGAPMADARLASADSLLHLNWLGMWNWMDAHPRIHNVLSFLYLRTTCEIALIPFLLLFMKRKRECEQFAWTFVIALFLTVSIGGLIPSYGAGYFYGVETPFWMSNLNALRSHTGNLLTSFGSVCFPSFHTVMALVSVYGVRKHRKLLILFAVVNGATLIAIPTEGSHYIVDVFGGALVTAVAIPLAHRIERVFSPKVRVRAIEPVREPVPVAEIA